MPTQKTFPWSSVTGADFGRANARAKTDMSVVWSAFDRIIIVAYSQDQMDIFCGNWRIPREKTQRWTEAIQSYGYNQLDPRNIMFLLPDYAKNIHESLFTVIHQWVNIGGKHVHVKEHQIRRSGI